LAFSAYVDAALYDPSSGFYAKGGVAGRRGDFLTSPEVGPLFGAVVGRALDRWWSELGRPDPFVLVEGGAGPGTLARSLHRAQPACSAALVHVLVERSAAQRGVHHQHLASHIGEPTPGDLSRVLHEPRAGRGPVAVSAADLPGDAVVGVVFANELLDNLAFDVVRRTPAGGVEEMRVAVGSDGSFEGVVVPRPPADPAEVALVGVAPGVWVPFQHQAAEWVRRARASLHAGRVVVVDYTATDAELSSDAALGWLRTYVGHGRGAHPLDAPGHQDITADVAVDQLLRACPGGTATTQARWLGEHGIGELVEEGRRRWAAGAHLGDLDAIRGRSRVGEAEALLDPDGLGAFGVLEWAVAPDDGR